MALAHAGLSNCLNTYLCDTIAFITVQLFPQYWWQIRSYLQLFSEHPFSEKKGSGLSDHKLGAFSVFISLRSHAFQPAFLCFALINIHRGGLHWYIEILLTLKTDTQSPSTSSFKILFLKSLIIYIIVLLKATLRLSCLPRGFFNCYAVKSDQLFEECKQIEM